MKNILFVLVVKNQPKKMYLDTQIKNALKDFHNAENDNLEPLLYVQDLENKTEKILLGHVDIVKEATQLIKSIWKVFYEKVFKRNEICIQRTNNRRRMFNGGGKW